MKKNSEVMDYIKHEMQTCMKSERILNYSLLMLIIAAGIFIRFHNLGAESIDLEEYACVGGVNAPTWQAFLEGQSILYPYGAPLAPSLIYFWTRLFGSSITTIRSLFATVSVLSLVLCYLLAGTLFRDAHPIQRQRAGLVAALCFALSPVHVFHAQEARMYALVSFFALISMGAFYRGLTDRKTGWWALHLLANAGLLASHYFTVFLLPVQGIALLLYERRISKRLAFWTVAQGLLLLLLLAWVSRIPRQAEDLYSYYGLPSLGIIAAHLFAGDSTTLSANSFFPSTLAWNWLSAATGERLRGLHGVFDVGMILVSVCSFACAAWLCIAALLRKKQEELWRWSVLLTWAFLPTIIIVVVSLVWQPVYGSRYVMYSIFALYFVMGGIALRIRRPRMYYAGLFFLLILYAYQLMLAYPLQTRTAWREALARIAAESRGTPVLLLEDPFWLPVLNINNQGMVSLPVADAFDRSSLCAGAALLNEHCGDVPEVWALLVLTTDFDEAPFTECLQEHHLSFVRYYYPGERRLALYRLRKEHPEKTPDTSVPDLYAPLTDALHKGDDAAAEDTFRKQIQYMPDPEGGFWLRLGFALAKHDLSALANTVFSHGAERHGMAALSLLYLAEDRTVTLDVNEMIAALAENAQDAQTLHASLLAMLRQAYYDGRNALLELLGGVAAASVPDFVEGHAFVGLALHRREAHREAVSSFQKAYLLRPHIMPEVSEAYAISLAAEGDYTTALEVLQKALEDWPQFHWFYLRLGTIYAEMGRHSDAITAYDRALEHLPNDFFIHFKRVESLLAMEHYEDALTSVRLPTLVDRPEPWIHLARWRALAGAGQHLEAKAALEKAASLNNDFAVLYEPLYGHPDPAAARLLLQSAREDNAPIAKEIALAVAHLEEQP